MRQDDRDKERALLAYLVARARSGDVVALDRLVRQMSPRLLAHAIRLLGERDAGRDAVQSAWIEILRALPSLRNDAAILPFALRITSRRVARVIRHRQRDRRLARDWATEADTETPAQGPAAVDARTIRAALDRLPPDHRATIALFYLEDMTVAEVAVAMDVPVGTVKTRLMHARAKLRGYLEGDRDD